MRIGLTRRPGTIQRATSLHHFMEMVRDACQPWPHMFAPGDALERSDALGDRLRCAESLVLQCDVVLAPITGPIELAAARCACGTKTRIVYFPLGDTAGDPRAFLYCVECLRPGDVIAVTCRSDLDILGALASHVPREVQHVPLGVDLDYWTPDACEQPEARRLFQIAPKAPLVAFAGRIIPSKNVHLALAVFRHVLARYPSAVLIMCGDIPKVSVPLGDGASVSYAHYLVRLCDCMGISEQVRWTGQVDRNTLRSVLRTADVALSLSTHGDENFGLAAVESMAVGLPVVGTRWGGQKDTLDGLPYAVETYVTDRGAVIPCWPAAAQHVLRSLETRNHEGLRGRVWRERAGRYSRTAFIRQLRSALCRRDHESDAKPEYLSVTGDGARTLLDLAWGRRAAQRAYASSSAVAAAHRLETCEAIAGLPELNRPSGVPRASQRWTPWWQVHTRTAVMSSPDDRKKTIRDVMAGVATCG